LAEVESAGVEFGERGNETCCRAALIVGESPYGSEKVLVGDGSE
jgi:hypothetical protein